MKFTVTMKDPDTLHDAIHDAVKAEVEALEILDADEKESLVESRREKFSRIAAAWFNYGEYLTVEIDTDAKTCTVRPASEFK